MKKILSGVLAAAMVASMASLTAMAAPGGGGMTAGDVFNGDMDEYLGGPARGGSESTYDGSLKDFISADGVVPATTFYYTLGRMGTDASVNATSTVNTGAFTPGSTGNPVPDVDIGYLTDSDYFKFKLDKDDNAKMINSVSVVTDKKLDNKLSGFDTQRGAFLKFVLNDSLTTDELKATGTITFTAKKDASSDTDATRDSQTFKSGDKFTYKYTLWINNEKKTGSDADADTGDRVYFSPESNEKNTFVWGDDRAAIEFNADDDASDFYCRLSTSNNSDIYAEYGDPVGAELWFFDFVGNMSIPSTSRASLTLGIPWDQDKDVVPNISDIRIYEITADGTLTDVTDNFKYSDDEYEIEGWTTQTRTLGSYIMSDTELDIASYDDEDLDDDITDDIGGDDITVSDPTTDKAIPNTGSSDMVSVAVVAAVVSLAAAGAVAFKKASK